MRERAAALWSLTKLAFRADRRGAIVGLALFAVEGILAAASTYWMASTIAAVVRLDAERAAFTIAALVVTDIVLFVVSMFALDVRFGLTERTGLLIERELVTTMTAAPTLELHERPVHLDRIEVLRKQIGALSNSIGALMHNVTLVSGLVTIIVLLASIHPVLALLPLTGAPALVSSARWTSVLHRTMDDTAERQRRADHLFALATAAGPAKELRTFGLGREIVGRHRELLGSAHRDIDRVSMRWGIITGFAWAVNGLGQVAAIAFMAWRAVSGDATVGDVIVTVTLVSQVEQTISQAFEMVSWLLNSLKTVDRYLRVIEDARALTQVTSEPAPAPARLTRGIELRDLSFRYPDADRDTLHGVSLTIPAGTTVALVGENGAGKSTLVKLLGRFYDPTGGTITVDGIDLERIDVPAWRARLSGAFQDHARFELVAGEVIGVGDLDRIDDRSAIAAALDRAGGGELPERLDRGLDTPLGRSFEDGIEPSGGQWQQLALGRALLRDQPLLLLLDEPTSALDPEAEHRLFEGYAAAARDAARASGAITLLVSHRFSTVRMADLIVVMEDGTVSQSGTHDELLALGGTYAELYTMQARAYQ